MNKEREKLEKIPAWDLAKVRSKSEVIDEAWTKGRKVHFASLMGTCHLKNAELETKHQKYKGPVVNPGLAVSSKAMQDWKMHHIDPSFLYVQQISVEKVLRFEKTSGDSNPSDNCAKGLARPKIRKFTERMSMEFIGGCASAAPNLV